MSKYEKQYDDEKIVCPYCQHSRRPMDAGGLDEEGEVEECDKCGKQYHLWREISVQQYTMPDCEINGELHSYQDMSIARHTVYPFCITCGKIRPLEKIQYIELHPHCQPPKCRLHEKSLRACTTCTRVGKEECTLITRRESCPKCGAEGHCEHYRGY